MRSKQIFLAAFIALAASQAFADTLTLRLGLVQPTTTFGDVWGVKVNSNYALLDSVIAGQNLANVFTSTNTFAGPTYFSTTTFSPGGYFTIDSNGKLTTQAGGGGGGASVLAVALGTTAGFTTQISSPTGAAIFNSSQFRGQLVGSATAYIDLNPSTTYFAQNQKAGPQTGTVWMSTVTGTYVSGSTASFSSGTYTNATISGPTLAYSTGTFTWGTAIGTNTLNGQSFRLFDRGNGVATYENQGNITTSWSVINNSTGTAPSISLIMQGSGTNAYTEAVSGDATVSSVNNLFLQGAGPTNDSPFEIGSNTSALMRWDTANNILVLGGGSGDVFAWETINNPTNGLERGISFQGAFGNGSSGVAAIYMTTTTNFGNAPFLVTNASGTFYASMNGTYAGDPLGDGGFTFNLTPQDTNDTRMPPFLLRAKNAAGGGVTNRLGGQVLISSNGVDIATYGEGTPFALTVSSYNTTTGLKSPSMFSISSSAIVNMGLDDSLTNLSILGKGISFNSTVGSFGSPISLNFFNSNTVLKVTNASGAIVNTIQPAGVFFNNVSNNTVFYVKTAAGIPFVVVNSSDSTHTGALVWAGTNSGSSQYVGFTSSAGVNLGGTIWVLPQQDSAGTWVSDGASHLTIGAPQSPPLTHASIVALPSSPVGQTYSCSDCATVPVCVSTGTATGSWSLITNKTSPCQ